MGPIIVTSTNVTGVDADIIFRTFTACPGDPRTLILDVRPHKDYAKKHILQSYSVRVSANGKALLVRVSSFSCPLTWKLLSLG